MQIETAPIEVLLVEDDEDDYMFTSEYLEAVPGQDYNVTWAKNYVDGLKTAVGKKFDVALVDYRIDTGTGLEFIRMAHARNVECPMILLTGVRSREVDIAAQQAGASDYLIKGSLNAEILERSIRYAIAHADRRRVLDTVLATIDAGVLALDANDGVILMNEAARKLVGLNEVGQYAPDNSIGLFSSVRRFLGEPPYPSVVYDSSGQAFSIQSRKVATGGKVIVLREVARGGAGGTVNHPQGVAAAGSGANNSGLTPAASHELYSWMNKILAVTKNLTKASGGMNWHQFAAELRHSGRRLVHRIDELQKRDTGGVIEPPAGQPQPQPAPESV